jgi:hypothetical protein
MDPAAFPHLDERDRMRWLEARLDALPDPGTAAEWKEAVLVNQRRRDAEFSLAAALQRMNGGRPAVTYSSTQGTTVRMFGVRASSDRGFEAACRLWIAKMLRRQATESVAPQRQ